MSEQFTVPPPQFSFDAAAIVVRHFDSARLKPWERLALVVTKH
jgi:hypothetical protein